MILLAIHGTEERRNLMMIFFDNYTDNYSFLPCLFNWQMRGKKYLSVNCCTLSQNQRQNRVLISKVASSIILCSPPSVTLIVESLDGAWTLIVAVANFCSFPDMILKFEKKLDFPLQLFIKYRNFKNRNITTNLFFNEVTSHVHISVWSYNITGILSMLTELRILLWLSVSKSFIPSAP